MKTKVELQSCMLRFKRKLYANKFTILIRMLKLLM